MQTPFDTYITTLGIDLEDLASMSFEQREAFYANVSQNLSEGEIEEIENLMGFFEEEIYTLRYQLQDIIDSRDSSNPTSVEEAARAEFLINQLNQMEQVAKEFSSEFGEGQQIVADHNIEASGNYTFNPDSSVENGEEFVIDVTTPGASNSNNNSIFGDDVPANFLDTNNDGIGDTNPDTNSDGIADMDFNEDGVIDETDMNIGVPQTQTPVITIDLGDPEITSVELVSYNPETHEQRLALTTADGTRFYITVTSSDGTFPNIRFVNPQNTTWITPQYVTDNLPPEVAGHWFEGSFNMPMLYYATGELPDTGDTGNYHTILNMADFDNEYTISPTTLDFQNGREYDITFDPETGDILNLNFPPDAELSFSHTADNSLVIYAEYGGQTIRIVIHDWSRQVIGDSAVPFDQIRITGGIITEEDYAQLNFSPEGETGYIQPEGAASIIFHNVGDDYTEEQMAVGQGSIFHQGIQSGYPWDSAIATGEDD